MPLRNTGNVYHNGDGILHSYVCHRIQDSRFKIVYYLRGIFFACYSCSGAKNSWAIRSKMDELGLY